MDVEIWSDLACPWCYIGKRRFERALSQFEERDEVRVTWRSFELDPSAPPERAGDAADHLARKYGTSRERALEGFERLTALAAAEGLEYRFDLLRTGNTFDAHRVLQLAAVHGVQDAVAERLFRGYLTEGRSLADHADVRALAAEAGLPDDEVGALLGGDDFAFEVRRDEQLAAAIGISAVPFFAIDRRIGATGAQDAEVLLEFLREGHRRRAAA